MVKITKNSRSKRKNNKISRFNRKNSKIRKINILKGGAELYIDEELNKQELRLFVSNINETIIFFMKIISNEKVINFIINTYHEADKTDEEKSQYTILYNIIESLIEIHSYYYKLKNSDSYTNINININIIKLMTWITDIINSLYYFETNSYIHDSTINPKIKIIKENYDMFINTDSYLEL